MIFLDRFWGRETEGMRKAWLFLIAGLIVVSAIAYFAFQEYQRQRLFANCYSDKLYPLAELLEQFNRDHGQFPDRETFFSSRFEEPGSSLGKCTGSNQPFVWNPRISEIRAESMRKVPLVWCPPGSHGKYVGVVVLAGGKVEAEIMTTAELDESLTTR